MSESTGNRHDLEAFAAFLECHGSDRMRWPAQERLAFAALLATSSEAKRLLREAELLDRLLDLAPGPAERAKTEDLAARISALAFAEAPPTQHWSPGEPRAARTTQTDAVSATPAPAEVRAQAASPVRAARAPEWGAIAVLAASLILGVVGGYAGTDDGALTSLLAETETDMLPDPVSIALDNNDSGLLGEDLL